MDYKKKYENALEWARQVINGECGFIRKEVEEVFPELKKSEDEKIRKDVLAFIRREGRHIDKYKWHKWIAWLEKQCGRNYEFHGIVEPRPAKGTLKKLVDEIGNPKFKVKYANGEYNVLEIKEIAGVTYFGIEDEPNHIDYVLPDNCEIVKGYGVKEKGSPYPTKSAIFSKQKPAWSEEDEEQVSIITDIVKAHCGKLIDCRANLKWLESLKQRLQ